VTGSSVSLLRAHYLNRDTAGVLKKRFNGFRPSTLGAQFHACLSDLVRHRRHSIDLSDPVISAKPENKPMLLWRFGMPVITSATPAYRRCMEAAGLDLVCESVDDRVGAIDSLPGSAGARKPPQRQALNTLGRTVTRRS
jgi:hypothetical protein